VAAGIPDALIVGGGLSGLALCQVLCAAGQSVTVLDRGRRVGGRCATFQKGGWIFDHGAQFFTARQPRLRQLIEDWRGPGKPVPWLIGPGGQVRYALPKGMWSLAAQLLRRAEEGGGKLALHTSCQVDFLHRSSAGFTAQTRGGGAFTGRRLFLTMPAPQLLGLAAELLPQELRRELEAVRYRPTWTALLGLSEQGRSLAGGWAVEDPVLHWVSADHDKVAGSLPALTLHAGEGWSAAHLEDPPASVQRELLAASRRILGELPVEWAMVHRWRYATALPAPTPGGYRWDAAAGVGIAGDGLAGPRVESALESGWGLGEAASG
jgi:predicted NAD/FAD-dependent oxidoreductase